jgi:MFS family permease
LVYAAGFPLTFIVAGLFGTLGAMVLYGLALPDLRGNRERRPFADILRELWSGLRAVAHNTAVVMTSVADAAKMIANGALMAFLPIYGVSVGLNPGEVGLLFGVQGVTSLFCKPVMGRVSDRVGRRPLIVIGLLVCAATFAAMPHAANFPVLLVLAAGFGFGEAVVSSSTAALVADRSALGSLGAGMGMQGMVMDIGHASGPLLAGVLIAALGYVATFGIIAAVQCLAAVAFIQTVKAVPLVRPTPVL